LQGPAYFFEWLLFSAAGKIQIRKLGFLLFFRYIYHMDISVSKQRG